jgi:regulator of protease activity HflC (stomatin/prohibitin superfamily)
MEIIGIAIGLGIFGAWALSRAFFRVDEGHVAVLTSFGAVLRDGKRLRLFRPGLHAKAPWQGVQTVAVKELNLDLSGEEGGRMVMAEDGTVLRFDSILRYVPLEDELESYLFGLKHRREHVTGLFTCLLRNEIANFRGPEREGGPISRALSFRDDQGSYALIRRERQLLNRRIEQFAKEKMGEKYGVRFSAVDITDILPPDELAEALNAVIAARAGADALYARAESDCQQRVLAAERGVDIAKARAAGAAIEILEIGKRLAELHGQGTLRSYVARRRAEVLSESRGTFYKAGVR